MTDSSSNRVLIFLVVLVVVLSSVFTWMVLDYNSARAEAQNSNGVQISQTAQLGNSGKVAIYIQPKQPEGGA